MVFASYLCYILQLSNSSVHSDLHEELMNLGILDVQTCYVKHCPNAFGVCITDKNGIKLTYSGDTMPCENLVEIGS